MGLSLLLSLLLLLLLFLPLLLLLLLFSLLLSYLSFLWLLSLMLLLLLSLLLLLWCYGEPFLFFLVAPGRPRDLSVAAWQCALLWVEPIHAARVAGTVASLREALGVLWSK